MPASFIPAVRPFKVAPFLSRQVSKIASKSMWVAAACGTLMSLLATLGAETIIGCEEGGSA